MRKRSWLHFCSWGQVCRLFDYGDPSAWFEARDVRFRKLRWRCYGKRVRSSCFRWNLTMDLCSCCHVSFPLDPNFFSSILGVHSSCTLPQAIMIYWSWRAEEAVADDSRQKNNDCQTLWNLMHRTGLFYSSRTQPSRSTSLSLSWSSNSLVKLSAGWGMVMSFLALHNFVTDSVWTSQQRPLLNPPDFLTLSCLATQGRVRFMDCFRSDSSETVLSNSR